MALPVLDACFGVIPFEFTKICVAVKPIVASLPRGIDCLVVLTRYIRVMDRPAFLLWQARQSGTRRQTISVIRRLAKTLLGDH